MEDSVVAPYHRQWTDRTQDYVAFEVRCAECRMLLFEFVHRQQRLDRDERLMAIPNLNPPMGGFSWYKPAVRVVCTPARDGGDAFHGFIQVGDGEDRNQVVTSRAMNQTEFEEWQHGNL